jgi:hypothetical protein
MAKQTAIEWFIEAIGYKQEPDRTTIINIHPDCDVSDLIKQAKQMEKEQIIDAMLYALDEDGHTGEWKLNFVNNYYNQILNHKK